MSGNPEQAVRARVEVVYERGVHARPATVIATHAQRYQADVALVLVSSPEEISTPMGARADAKNVMEVMFLAAPAGARLDVEATGPDAEAAVEDLVALFEHRFGIS